MHPDVRGNTTGSLERTSEREVSSGLGLNASIPEEDGVAAPPGIGCSIRDADRYSVTYISPYGHEPYADQR